MGEKGEHTDGRQDQTMDRDWPSAAMGPRQRRLLTLLQHGISTTRRTEPRG
jgi:hypothetical protein